MSPPHDFSDIPQGQGTIRRLKCIAAAIKRIQHGDSEEEIVNDFKHRGYTEYKAHDYFETAADWVNDSKETPEGKKRLADVLKAAYEAGREAEKKEAQTEKK